MLRDAIPIQFEHGGHRLALPLAAGDRLLGLAILADRVNGVPYTVEDRELLKCIGDQLAAGLLNLQLREELTQAREMEAFQAVSAFFVHDMKNVASSLNLMLENLPVHFDDPEFREDALRAIGSSADRINHLIERLGALRQKPELEKAECNLNDIVRAAIHALNGSLEPPVVEELEDIPPVYVDREQMESVVTNLVINGGEAAGPEGSVRVHTECRDDAILLTVADDGCGMTPEFVRKSLFRPFESTKKKGLGIGMFQTKMIIEAHRGKIQVESEPGKGTTIRVSLPVKTD